jgi:PAS domain S-box-containing protein
MNDKTESQSQVNERPDEQVGRLQQALSQAQANLLRYQELFDFAPDGYLVTDPRGVIQEANHAAAAMLGTSKQFLVNKPLLFFVSETNRWTFTLNLNRLSHQGESRLQWEMGLTPRRAAPLRVLVTATPGPADEGHATLRWVLRDVTQRRRVEESLRGEQELASSLLQLAEVVVLMLDQQDLIVEANPYACSLTGYHRRELVGRPLAELLFPMDLPLSERRRYGQIAVNPNFQGVSRLRTKEGRTRTVAWSSLRLSSTPSHYTQLVVGNDITDLEEAQEQVLRAERLAAIGQTVTVLAHEGRNILQRAVSCLQRLEWRLEEKPEALDLCGRAQQALHDLTRLFDDLRTYAAPLRLDRAMCNLAEVWRKAWEQATALRKGRDARLEEDVAGCVPTVEVDAARLTQVFRNLFENALDACSDPLRVGVRCRPVQLGDRPGLGIMVSDNGPGFAADQ